MGCGNWEGQFKLAQSADNGFNSEEGTQGIVSPSRGAVTPRDTTLRCVIPIPGIYHWVSAYSIRARLNQ